MNRSVIKRSVDATVEPLSEITRAAVWQRIEDTLATPLVRRRWVPLATFAAGAAIAAVIVLVMTSERVSTLPRAERVVLVLPTTGEYTHAFAGSEVTLYGPGELELDATLASPALRVRRGTVVVRRQSWLAPIQITTPDSSSPRTVFEPVFTLRVTEVSTEFASGDYRASVLLDRDVEDLAPPAPAAVPSPAAPASASAASPARAPGPRRQEPSVSEPLASAPAPAPTPEPAEEAAPNAPSVSEPPPSPAQQVETLSVRYARAEQAIAAGDRTTARKLLEEIVRDGGSDRLAAMATYDLALLAFQRRDYAAALQHIDRVLADTKEPNLHPAARRLRCKIQTARGMACQK